MKSIAEQQDIRARRRALVTGAVVAVLGGGALIGGPALMGADAPASPSERPAVVAPAAGGGAESTLAESVAEPAVAKDAVRAPSTLAPETGAPWQDSPPPLPEGGLLPENADWPNAWEIPDARPTGVDYLDRFGAPKQGMNYPRMVPVSGVMMCNTDAEDVEPESAQSWMYFMDDDWVNGAVDISITGWADSVGARDALRDDTMTFCVRDTASGWQPLEWVDHAGDGDYLLYEASSGAGLEFGFAIVRQGDYLVGVTVTDTTGEVNAEAAAAIAGRTADNLEALDPVHGRD